MPDKIKPKIEAVLADVRALMAAEQCTDIYSPAASELNVVAVLLDAAVGAAQLADEYVEDSPCQAADEDEDDAPRSGFDLAEEEDFLDCDDDCWTADDF